MYQFTWLAWGFASGAACFYIPAYAFNSPSNSKGLMEGIYVQGLSIMIIIVTIDHLIIAWSTRHWQWYMYVVYALSYSFLIWTMLFDAAIPGAKLYRNIWVDMMGSPIMWLSLIITVAIMFLPYVM